MNSLILVSFIFYFSCINCNVLSFFICFYYFSNFYLCNFVLVLVSFCLSVLIFSFSFYLVLI